MQSMQSQSVSIYPLGPGQIDFPQPTHPRHAPCQATRRTPQSRPRRRGLYPGQGDSNQVSVIIYDWCMAAC